jgi:predicted O-methyltransferase YrrM
MMKIEIDEAHALLISGLIAAHKPRRVLEMGFGRGVATQAILQGLEFNEVPFAYDLVDNWTDFGRVKPDITEVERFFCINFITDDEKSFVHCEHVPYDFIMSDADHYHTHEWFDRVYTTMLAPGGILIYHDITNRDFPNLMSIYTHVYDSQIGHVLFNKSTRHSELCDRGLLVIFK